jgi:phospholipid/cholesterol/gamma-HCH transport system substrate-binding protein
MNAIRKRAREFIAVVVLVILALVVGGYILSQQRFSLPGWVPLLGKDFFTLKAEFTTAQAVTPGQGQTVDIAGVEVGEIQNVQLRNGHALVTMKLKPKYDKVYPDATMLLRPKTGLKDMVVEMDPGNPSAGKPVKDGATIPVQNTLPDVNLDEILGALDADTRTYLRLLLGGAGQGLRDNEQDLSSTLRRLEPTSRDIAKITGQLKERRANIRRTVHNFQLLANALGDKDDQLAQLVDSSNRVFRSFARQDDNLRAALEELPSTLEVTDTALTKAGRMADELGPTLGALRPGARALGPALAATRPFLRESTPIVRDQLRPFSRDVRPVVRELRPAARDLSKLTPDLVSSFKVLNYVLDTLAYNPPGTEEGYLFWASWVNHAGLTIFNGQDAHGPIRRGLVLASCSTLQTLNVIGSANERLGTLAALLNAPSIEQACGQKTSQAGARATAPSASEGGR